MGKLKLLKHTIGIALIGIYTHVELHKYPGSGTESNDCLEG